MVNHIDAKTIIRLREHRLKAKINKLYAAKIDVITARMYSDDTDIQRGALSAPCNQFRPGQRNYAPVCTSVRFLPAL